MKYYRNPRSLFDAQCTPCGLEEMACCQYCIKLCDTCFKPVPVNPLTVQPPEESDLSFKFCSQPCYETSVFPSKSDLYFLVRDDGTLCCVDKNMKDATAMNFIPSCRPILESHKVHLHSLCMSTNWAGYTKLTEQALCSGVFPGSHAEQYYIVYRGKSLTGQLCLEFYISDTLSPTAPLPHTVSTRGPNTMYSEAEEELEELANDGMIVEHLKELMNRICADNIADSTVFSLSLVLSCSSKAIAKFFSPSSPV